MGGVPFTMDVELGKIREFARATKSSNPDYLLAEQPVSPATFLTTWAHWSAAGDSPLPLPPSDWSDAGGLDPNELLPGGQEFVFHGEPPRAGTRLVGQLRIGAAYSTRDRRGETVRLIEIINHFRTTDGRLVAEMKTTLVTAVRPPAAAAGADATTATTGTGATADAGPQAPRPQGAAKA